MQFFNQHSFSIFAFLLVFAIGLYLFRRPLGLQELLVFLLLLAGIASAYVFFNPLASPTAAPAGVEAALDSGEPMLIEFESPY